ncbi:hypothetical protein ACVI1K_007855 [Bradyrhizobium sp. USDA 4508]
MKRFKSSRQAQRFLSVHDQAAKLFSILYPGAVAADFRRASRERAFATWREISTTSAIAESPTSENPLLRLSGRLSCRCPPSIPTYGMETDGFEIGKAVMSTASL